MFDADFWQIVWRRALLFGGALAYLFVFHWSYLTFVWPNFNYLGYTYQPLGVGVFWPMYLAAAAPTLWLPITLERPSQILYWLLYVMVFVPSYLVPAYAGAELGPMTAYATVLLAAFALVGCIYWFPLIRFPRLRLSPPAFGVILAASTAALYAPILGTFGLHFKAVSLSSVYQVRAEYSQALASSSVLVAYCVNWLSKVLNPFLLALGLTHKKLWLVGASLIGQCLIYSITGYKDVLFSSVLVVALLVVMASDGRRLGLLVMWGSVGLIVVTTLVDTMSHSILLRSLFVRRLLVVPGLVTGHYVEFFSHNPKVLMSQSILRQFLSYPYSLEPANLIGWVYYGDSTNHVNANLWADAFANYGFAGVLIFSVFLALFLWIFDSLSKDRDRTAGLLLGVAGLVLVNGSLLTAMLTGGLLFVLILIFLMPHENASALRGGGL